MTDARIDSRLRAVLESARETTPWWTSRIPARFDSALDVLRDLRPLTRSELQRERVRLTSTTGVSLRWRTVRTSGTTGQPVEMILDDGAIRAEGEAFANHLDRLLGDEWRAKPVIHLALHAEASSRAWRAPWSAYGVVVKWNLASAWPCISERNAAFRHLDGAILTGLPSVLRLVASIAGASIRPRAVVLSGEAVGESARFIVETIPTIVTSHYALAETGIAGVACSSGEGYHVALENVWMEIVDETILLTTLENASMRLIRYDTGDRGRWLEPNCGCGDKRSRFTVMSRRAASSHACPIEPVRVAKAFCDLGVQRYEIRDEEDGVTCVTYHVQRSLDSAKRALIRSLITHVAKAGSLVRLEEVSQNKITGFEISPPPRDPQSLADWIAGRLRRRTDIVTAAFGGSYLDPCAQRRGSDIDLIVLVREREGILDWMSITEDLSRAVPRLSVHVDVASNLASSAPLLVARLLDSHLHVTGLPLERVLAKPEQGVLCDVARYFCQNARATLWEQWTRIDRDRSFDPIAESGWIARISLDAMRYRQLLRGSTKTRMAPVLDEFRRDPAVPAELVGQVVSLIEISLEHRPPPLVDVYVLRDWIRAAWMCVELGGADGM